MAVPRSYLLYLEDMQEAMARIARYCAGLDFEQFRTNELVTDAVVRNLEVVGEAAKKIPLDVQQLYPQLPWSQMYRMRNRISHEYFGLDYAVIWRVVTYYLPENHQYLLSIIEAERQRLS